METTTTVTTAAFDAVKNGIGGAVSVMEQIVNAVTGNPVLLVFLSASVFVVGIGIFRRLKA
ncbi:MAG TPA: hypothetical protein DDZ89_00880 [Clostridiales bacterium]|nr:hypothetical protein [Clostridiales bacterium]